MEQEQFETASKIKQYIDEFYKIKNIEERLKKNKENLKRTILFNSLCCRSIEELFEYCLEDRIEKNIYPVEDNLYSLLSLYNHIHEGFK